jgi:predicted NBD/HSP70 family sugar kinase
MVNAVKSPKATHEQLRLHNRQLVLRMLYTGEVNTRAALATITGLTKPTISNLVSELISEGLVSEGGLGTSTGSGGKRPTLLAFEPDARQVIGVAVDPTRAIGVLSNLAGQPTALHSSELKGATGSGAVIQAINDVVNGLIPQLDSPLLCLGVAIPGQIKSASGVVQHSAALALNREPLGENLADAFGVPVHLGNYAEVCALGQLAYGPQESSPPRTLVTLMLDEDVELGVSLQHGKGHFGSELAGPLLSELQLGWSSTKALAAQLLESDPGSLLAARPLRYLTVRYAAALGDATALELQQVLARRLARLAAWVVSILQPSHVSLAGGASDLGDAFLTQLRCETAVLLGPGELQDVTFSMAYSEQLGAMGAVALATQNELELLS